MAFIGNTPTTQAFTPAIDYFSGTGSATAFTLSRPVASVAQVQVTIDNVAQNPSSAYTVSGSTITFTSAPLSGTNNIYVYYTSPITQVIAPGQGTVTATALDVYGSSGVGASNLPSGTTAQRPSAPANGAVRMNSTTGNPEWYSSATTAWISFNQAVSYSVSYLIVAGGGGGGGGNGGPAGGGAGGLLSGTSTLNSTVAYSITVGAGGAGGGSNQNGTIGSNSVFNSNTSIAGGYGGCYNGTTATNGGAGGSGGGGGGVGTTNGTGGSATSGQGYAGGNGFGSAVLSAGGGGGGAGQVGNGTTNGQGGNGLASSITGTSVTYAGGGGGASDNPPSGYSGGSGGGGAGSGTGVGTAGTANLGGGGGAGRVSSGASGGSGIVIISYVGAQRGTGGTVTTSNGSTIHTFTSSSTYTA